MQRAWISIVLCSMAAAQPPKGSRPDELVTKLTEARERAPAARTGINLPGAVPMPNADADAARRQGLTLLRNPPDRAQTVASLAEIVMALDDDAVRDAPTAAARTVLLRRAAAA